MKQYLPVHLFFYLLLTIMPAQAREQEMLSPAHIIEQELLLNELIANLYLLRLDFQDQRAREELDGLRIQLDEALHQLPDTHSNLASQHPLPTSQSQWKAINLDLHTLLNKSNEPAPDSLSLIINNSLKLDRQLLALRTHLLAEQPQVNDKLRFMTQALLMQKLTRDYLHLATTDTTVSTHIKHEQLQTMAKQFNKSLNDLQKKLLNHRHAETPVRKASMAWHFIADSIDRLPEKPVPTTIVIYSDRIIRQLSSLHHMF